MAYLEVPQRVAVVWKQPQHEISRCSCFFNATTRCDWFFRSVSVCDIYIYIYIYIYRVVKSRFYSCSYGKRHAGYDYYNSCTVKLLFPPPYIYIYIHTYIYIYIYICILILRSNLVYHNLWYTSWDLIAVNTKTR